MTEGETRHGEISIDIDYMINSGMMNYSDGDMAIFSSSGQANFEATLKLEVLAIAPFTVSTGCSGCRCVKAGIAATSSLMAGLYFMVQLPSG